MSQFSRYLEIIQENRNDYGFNQDLEIHEEGMFSNLKDSVKEKIKDAVLYGLILANLAGIGYAGKVAVQHDMQAKQNKIFTANADLFLNSIGMKETGDDSRDGNYKNARGILKEVFTTGKITPAQTKALEDYTGNKMETNEVISALPAIVNDSNKELSEMKKRPQTALPEFLQKFKIAPKGTVTQYNRTN